MSETEIILKQIIRKNLRRYKLKTLTATTHSTKNIELGRSLLDQKRDVFDCLQNFSFSVTIVF